VEILVTSESIPLNFRLSSTVSPAAAALVASCRSQHPHHNTCSFLFIKGTACNNNYAAISVLQDNKRYCNEYSRPSRGNCHLFVSKRTTNEAESKQKPTTPSACGVQGQDQSKYRADLPSAYTSVALFLIDHCALVLLKRMPCISFV
jgi:hypothetical protein